LFGKTHKIRKNYCVSTRNKRQQGRGTRGQLGRDEMVVSTCQPLFNVPSPAAMVLQACKCEASRPSFAEVPSDPPPSHTRPPLCTEVATGDQTVPHNKSPSLHGTCPAVPTEWHGCMAAWAWLRVQCLRARCAQLTGTEWITCCLFHSLVFRIYIRALSFCQRCYFYTIGSSNWSSF
jgi:hypothetical protein